DTTPEILQLIWRVWRDLTTGEKKKIDEITLSKTMGKEGIRQILQQIYDRKRGVKPGSLIDVAALFRDVADRADVAEEILRLDCWENTSIKGVIYYDTENRLMVMKRQGGEIKAVDLESCGLTREELIAFWDQQHTTGSDLKVDRKGTATMTIGKDTILRDWEQ